jgi:putative transposase
MGVPSEVRGQLAVRFEAALLGSVTPPNDPRNQPNHRADFLRLPGGAQRFLPAFSGISPHFRTRRHLLHAQEYRHEMAHRFSIWNDVTGLTTTA